MQKYKIVYYDEREVRKKSIEKLSAEQAFALFSFYTIFTRPCILLNLSIFISTHCMGNCLDEMSNDRVKGFF